MSVPHPGGDPNAQLYAQLKRDVLDRVPHITTVEYIPDDVEARQLEATFDPDRLDPPTGPALRNWSSRGIGKPPTIGFG